MIQPSTLYPGKRRAMAYLKPWLFRWSMAPDKRRWAAANYRKYAEGPHLRPRVRAQDMPRLIVTDDWIIRVN